MSRMTQFKDKTQDILTAEDGETLTTEDGEPILLDSSGPKGKNISVGLFNYPVLMAADILLYGAEYIPVGDDQTQHLEFTRDIAERMNNRFGELFVVPKPVKDQHEFFGKDQGLRVRDLQEPTRKMSKSAASDKGVIFLTDAPEQARKKIMSAATDSLGQINYDYANQPGIANLLDMLKLLGGEPAEFIGQSQYGPLKAAVADRVAELLGDFQSRLASVETDVLNEKLTESEDRMRNLAGERLYRVQQAVGLRPL